MEVWSGRRPYKQRVVQQLDVVPFNRVSRTERSGDHPAKRLRLPMPTPAVTHAVFSKSRNDLVTMDVVPTENVSVGAPLSLLPNDAPPCFGSVTTIRFWQKSSCSSSSTAVVDHMPPYELKAAMTFPHGSRNRRCRRCSRFSW